MQTKGFIYILTNPSFKEYVKIGYADNVEARLKQLNNSECIPFAFRVYATYEVEERLTDKKLHSLIDQLNPNLRSIDNVGGKVRVREFYAMSPEQAYSILETIAILGGHRERLKLWAPSAKEQKDEDLAQEIEEEHIERQSPFTFSKCHIPVGATITYFNRGKANSGVECVVVDDKAVEYQGKKYSLSAVVTNDITGIVDCFGFYNISLLLISINYFVSVLASVFVSFFSAANFTDVISTFVYGCLCP